MLPSLRYYAAIVTFSLVCLFVVDSQQMVKQAPQKYCSFFNNRAPTAQPGLKNCTWFKEDSCCLQQEIAATFGRVKPLKGASPSCQKYINYLMCYICAPNQNIFYQEERLTVCKSFCDNLFAACGSAILKGSVISALYKNGEGFCLSRRFRVNTTRCFTFDESVLKTSGCRALQGNLFQLLMALTVLYIPCLIEAATQCTSYLSPASKQRINKTRSKKGTHLPWSGKSQLIGLQMGVEGLNIAGFINLCWHFDSVLGSTRVNMCSLTKHNKRLFHILLLFCMISPSNASHAVHQSGSMPRLGADTVRNWAKLISKDLTEFAKGGMNYEELQRLYDEAEYTTEYVNATERLLQVREKLAKFFSSKNAIGLELAREVQTLYDTWQDRDLSGDGPVYNKLSDLPRDVYRDSDLPETLGNMTYSKEFHGHILEYQSTVKIPDEMERDSPAVIDTIRWTAGLDNIFRENRKKDPSIKWQYFASYFGVHRMFPGQESRRNFIGFHEDYDPRIRPWYVSTTSGPKNVIIIIDGSTNMAADNSLSRARQVALNVLNTLTKHDFVNIILSKSPFWTEEGDYVNTTTEVLSCEKSRLIPASFSHKKVFSDAIENQIVPNGGSNHEEAFKKAFELLESTKSKGEMCQNLIVFVSAGENWNNSQRCKPGFYRFTPENKKNFVPGEICYHDLDVIIDIVPLLQDKLPKRAHLFTFLTRDHSKGHERPVKLGCDNQGATAKITSNSNSFRQMAPYFRFLESSSGSDDPLWTSPYRDTMGQGLMVTLAVPVHSNVTQQHLGVVGLDIPLKVLEEAIEHELWGNVYAFITDSDDGSTILHPLAKPDEQLLSEAMFIPITALETHNKEPADFRLVLQAIEEQSTGEVVIRDKARRAVSLHDSLLWRPVEQSKYVFTDIPGSDFSLAYNVLQSDEVYQHARDPSGPTPVSYLDNMEVYAKLDASLANAYSELRPTSNHPKYPGLSISINHSVVHLAKRAFCNESRYLATSHHFFAGLHNHINAVTDSIDNHCPQGLLHPDIRPDIKLSSRLEQLWTSRPAKLQAKIVWTYVGTQSGMMRIYPATQMSPNYDPTRRPWYNQAQVYRGTLSLSSGYLDPYSHGRVVTLSRAVHKAKPLTPPDCIVDRRDYGCPCEKNYQCKSDYCQDTSCADDIIQGVVAMDTPYTNLVNSVNRVIARHSHHNQCGQKYGCSANRDVICETRCYIVDSNMNFVTNPDFANYNDLDEHLYTDIPLASRHGYIARALLLEGVFIKHTRIDYQAACSTNKDPGERRMPPYNRKHHTDFACVMEVVYYTANKSRVDYHSHSSGPLVGDPCSTGYYHFTPIPETNVFLLVLDDHRDLRSHWNFNCRIQNRLYIPHSYRVTQNECSRKMRVIPKHARYQRRHCVAPRDVPLSCGLSQAHVTRPQAYHTHFAQSFCTLLLYHVLYMQ